MRKILEEMILSLTTQETLTNVGVIMITQVFIGIFLGTFGLAWQHHMAHKFNLFRISYFWGLHQLHHKKNDPEQVLRKKYPMSVYAVISSIKYLKVWNYKGYEIVYIGLLSCFGMLPAFLISLYIAECIGYLQHDYDGNPIDFTNRFDNFVGFDCGYHSKHHKNPAGGSTNTEVIFGLFISHLFIVCVILLMPIYILNPLKSNIKGVTLFGFFQNLANVRAEEGFIPYRVLYRMSSVFDKPQLFIQYFRCLFNKEDNFNIKFLSVGLSNNETHDVSDIRNIYRFRPDLDKGDVITYKNKVVSGHHRNRIRKERIC